MNSRRLEKHPKPCERQLTAQRGRARAGRAGSLTRSSPVRKRPLSPRPWGERRAPARGPSPRQGGTLRPRVRSPEKAGNREGWVKAYRVEHRLGGIVIGALRAAKCGGEKLVGVESAGWGPAGSSRHPHGRIRPNLYKHVRRCCTLV